MKGGQVLQKLQAVVARSQIPVEDSQVNGMGIGNLERRLRVGGAQNLAIQFRLGEPFADRLANRAFVIDDQNGVLHTSATSAPALPCQYMSSRIKQRTMVY